MFKLLLLLSKIEKRGFKEAIKRIMIQKLKAFFKYKEFMYIRNFLFGSGTITTNTFTKKMRNLSVEQLAHLNKMLDNPDIIYNPDILKQVQSNNQAEWDKIMDKFIIKRIADSVVKQIKRAFIPRNPLSRVKNQVNRTVSLFTRKDGTVGGKAGDGLQEVNWTSINSSWIKLGHFEFTNASAGIGNMTLMFESGGKWYGGYTYPSVPYEVWRILSVASAHAGTLFWRYWLRSWLPSQLRNYTKETLADKMGITAGTKRKTPLPFNNVITLIVDRRIKRIAENFRKLKGSKEFGTPILGSQGFVNRHKQMLVKQKLFFKNVNFKTTKSPTYAQLQGGRRYGKIIKR